MNTKRPHQRSDLYRLAGSAMTERGLEAEFSGRVLEQLSSITGPGRETAPAIDDLTGLPWCSIDNDDSLDLDQLTVCEVLPNGAVKLLVAIADVDTLVKKGTPIDNHARLNTTSVYTSARIFPMLPERLSTDLTSLNAGEERLALVTEIIFSADGVLASSTVRRARVRNQAKLAYDSVAAWIEGQGDLPAAAAAIPGLEAQLRTQDALAQQLRAQRQSQGALEFQTFQPRAVFEGEKVVGIRQQEHNRARQLIEEVMIATNVCTARFLTAHGARRRFAAPRRAFARALAADGAGSRSVRRSVAG